MPSADDVVLRTNVDHAVVCSVRLQPGGWQRAVEEEGFADLHAAEDVGGQQRYGCSHVPSVVG